MYLTDHSHPFYSPDEDTPAEGDLLDQSDEGEASPSAPEEEGSAAAPTSPPDADAGLGESPVEESAAKSGWIPLDRHQAILDNARREAQTIREKAGWAESLDREQVQEALFQYQTAQRHQQQIADQEPEPDRQDEQGNLYYSPERARQHSEWASRRLRMELQQEFEQRLAPLEQKTILSERTQAAQAQVEAAQAWPLFNEHVEQITNLIAAAATQGQQIGLRQAYDHLVLPKLAANRQQLEAELRRKIIADMKNTTSDVNPSRASAPASTKPSTRSLEDELEANLAGVPL